MRSIILLILLAILGCKKQFNTSNTPNSNEWISDNKGLYESGESIEIKIRFEGEGKFRVLRPKEPLIELKSENDWLEVKTIYCNCNPCPGPPIEIDYKMGEPLVFEWDQMSEECTESNELKLTRMMAGSYRFSYDYINLNSGKRSKIIEEFKIPN